MAEENHTKNSDFLTQGLTKTLKFYLIASNRYESIGCFKDNTTSPAIETLEGKDDILDGNYSTRNDSIDKCFRAAERQRFHIFAVQDGGRCQASASAIKTFHKYNQSSQKCPSGGKGGKQINHVYYIKGKSVINILYQVIHATTAVPRKAGIMDPRDLDLVALKSFANISV